MTPADVVDHHDAERYEIRTANDVAGYAEYQRAGRSTAFTHTIVESRYEGHGVGSALARGALDAERAAGRSVLPYCPFIRSWILRHPDYLDLVPVTSRQQFGLAPAEGEPGQR